jgi:hypothetical protein
VGRRCSAGKRGDGYVFWEGFQEERYFLLTNDCGVEAAFWVQVGSGMVKDLVGVGSIRAVFPSDKSEKGGIK